MRRILFVLILLTPLAACDKLTPPNESRRVEVAPAAPLDLRAETPAARRLTSFINAVRTGERAAVEALIQEEMAGFLQEIPLDDHVSELMSYHPGFSQITFHHLTHDEPFAAEGLFHNAQSGGWVRIGVAVEEEEPHRIYRIELQPAEAPAAE